jgi:hypothetical protein
MKRTEGWKVYDVVVENLSLTNTGIPSARKSAARASKA